MTAYFFRAMAALATSVILSLVSAHAGEAAEPSATGLWQKIENGKPEVWILFVERGGIFEGGIARTFPKPGEAANPICSKCTDDRKNHGFLGISLIRNMKRDGLRYEGGNILDPRDGAVYKAKMSISPNGQELTLRGYFGFSLLGRDEIWHRLPDTDIVKVDLFVIAKYLPERLTPSKPVAHSTAAQRPNAPSKTIPYKP